MASNAGWWDWTGTNNTTYAHFANMYNRAGKGKRFAIRNSLRARKVANSRYHIGVKGNYIGISGVSAFTLAAASASGYAQGRRSGKIAGAKNAPKLMPVAYAKGLKKGL